MENGERGLATRVSVLEFQINRMVSDIESEKGTRARINEGFMEQLEKIRDGQEKSNKILYMLMGGIAVVQVVIQFLRH